MKKLISLVFAVLAFCSAISQSLTINSDEYFEMPGLNVMVFYDISPKATRAQSGLFKTERVLQPMEIFGWSQLRDNGNLFLQLANVKYFLSKMKFE